MAAIASQAGHLLVYQIRFGSAAASLQSSGAHAYFPALAKTGVGIAAAGMIFALLAAGLARVVNGRRVEFESPPPYVRLLAGLFTIQLALYCAQETFEAQLSGTSPGSAGDLLVWGAIGQLPPALLAALALRWLLAAVRPALHALTLSLGALEQRAGVVFVHVPIAAPAPALLSGRPRDGEARRRGPPYIVR